MRVRITCDENHPLGKRFKSLYPTIEFFSRRTGFDIHNQQQLDEFIQNTENYDLTINFTRAMRFGQVKLLTMLDEHCDREKLLHKVFNIGSYTSIVLLNSPESSYDIEKASTKMAHRKIAASHMFHGNYLDSYLLTLGHLDEISVDIHKHYEHLDTLLLDDVIANAKFMMDRPKVKELSVHYRQPGNHRVNDGIGLIFPGIY
jgi:hypothetical protein